MDATEQPRQHHPRRPPAHRSVSLLHSPKRESTSIATATKVPQPSAKQAQPRSNSDSSDSSLKPPISKDDSGESSNADKWFEKSNNNVSGNAASFTDSKHTVFQVHDQTSLTAPDSPPFFLRNSSSSETPPEKLNLNQANLFANNASANFLPQTNSLLHLDTPGGSSTEDFRSVIDDLTVQNKKLKRRLEKYEKLHDAHLKNEKLFEVRVHGLPVEKKRELEEMLRKFTITLGQQDSHVANMYERMVPGLKTQKTDFSQSTVQFSDSAYMSASASGGQASSAQSGSASSDRKQPHSAKSRHQNVQSYLHDIPEGLLPRHPAVMTEKAKKKLVVRRLEQIFAGKGAAANGHHQPLQQQEVSHSAAKADRSVQGQRLTLEGMREARIMNTETEDPLDPESIKRAAEHSPTHSSTLDIKPSHKVEQQDFAEQIPVDQRPTRPLDLDPYRAQIPADNFQYLHHLGFSPPGAQEMEAYEEGHGWIYLNLLINMAQLHTINVTSDFVTKAVSDYSQKFELSNDGRKVRWKGGRNVTRHSSDSEDSPNQLDLISRSDDKSPRKCQKTSHNPTKLAKPTPGSLSNPENKFMYTPLFAHKSSTDGSDDEDSSIEEDTESPFAVAGAGDSSGMRSSGMRTARSKNKKRDDGPIIFYNNAHFCTDLSGDRKTQSTMLSNPLMYHSVSSQAVGISKPPQSPLSSEKRGPLDQNKGLPEAMDLSDNPIPDSMEISFPPQTPLSSPSERSLEPVNFEATGLGGVCPADNFAIKVLSRHTRLDNETASENARQEMPRKYSSKIANVLREGGNPSSKARRAFHKEVLSSRREELPPSDLPPASMWMALDESSDEDDSDAESDSSFVHEPPDAFPPSAAPQAIDMAYVSDGSSSGEESDEEDDDGESETESVDLLATARQHDPERIRAQERQYDADMAERLAEEIPAGSSAATAGGGSGFASPASGVSNTEYLKAQQQVKDATAVNTASNMPSLKRSRTSDSMVVDALVDEDEGDDEDEEMNDYN
ncbi:hypothetical protein M8818_004595 [Zalaria obscura]|uniref:Uncharacterized protein n=1 Tax=Zalaria obscura TaxID=2024903 RepID=A0ACC3SCE0_9PEZI